MKLANIAYSANILVFSIPNRSKYIPIGNELTNVRVTLML